MKHSCHVLWEITVCSFILFYLFVCYAYSADLFSVLQEKSAIHLKGSSVLTSCFGVTVKDGFPQRLPSTALVDAKQGVDFNKQKSA